jgi:hypothetical protein
MPKKKLKLESLSQTHGKVEKAVTLDQVWGDTGGAKYGTLDLEKYTTFLDDLNKSDLQAHAIKIGLVPIDDRRTLVTRLKKEFQKHVAQFQVKENHTSNKPISKSARDILSEGR